MSLALAAAALGFSLTASPAAIHATAGQTAHVTVTDTGSAPVNIRTSLVTVGGTRCGITGSQVNGITVTPASFSLGPGQRGEAVVTISARAPAQDDAVLFTSQPGHGGNLQVSEAVGTRLVIGTAAECHPPASGRAAAGSITAARGSDAPAWIATGWLLLCAALGGIIWRRRRKNAARRG